MKKISLFLMAFVLFVACNNEKKGNNGGGEDDKEITLKKKKLVTEEESSGDDTKSSDRTVTDVDNSDEDATDSNEDATDKSEGWPIAGKKGFMKNCVEAATTSFGATAAKNYCSCMMEKLERRYPNPLDAARLTQEDTQPLAAECLNLNQ